MRRSATRCFSSSCSSRRFAILDETDSGLDVDALRVVSEGVNRVRASGEVGTLLITHYTRILRYITPDFVHVMSGRPHRRLRRSRARRHPRERGLRAVRRHRSSMSTDWPYDVEKVRADFPILTRRIHDGVDGGVPLVYLDSAATSQKPLAVLDAEREYNERHNANVHRGIHTLAEEATALYEGAREKVASFLGTGDPREILFAKNVTEGLNLLARSIGEGLRPGDEVVVTEMEHHSNLVPWQLACERSGATLRWFGLTDDGRLDLARADAEGLINERTKVVSFVHQSNILGTVNPVAEIVARAKAVGALTMLDGAQSVPHGLVGVARQAGDVAGPARTVAELGVDFLGFTGHKMLGPTGIGGLWGRYDLLAELPPFLGGGEMVDVVTMAASDLRRPAAPLRGRHPADRAGGRARGGRRLPVSAGHRPRGPSRAPDHRVRARPPGRGARAAGHRPADGRGPRRGDFLCAARDSPARHRAAARRARHRGAGRPALRAAGLLALRRAGDDPDVAPTSTRHRRDRRARGRSADRCEVLFQVSSPELESMYQEIILDHYRHPHHKGLREGSTPRSTT